MLARRLSRRGVPLSGGSLAVLLAQESASASMPTRLIGSTAQAASLIAAGRAVTAGMVSAEVAALTREVLKMMLLSKIKVGVAMFLVASALAVGGTGLAYRVQADDMIQGKKAQADVTPSGPAFTARTQPGDARHGDPGPGGTVEAKSLREAVRLARQPLEDSKSGKADQGPYDSLLLLLTEERVKATIPRAIKAYEELLGRGDARILDSRDYFYSTVRPRLVQIAEEGAWPKGCSFKCFPVASSDGVASGYGLTLAVGTPEKAVDLPDGGKKFVGFDLPIIQISFGRFK